MGGTEEATCPVSGPWSFLHSKTLPSTCLTPGQPHPHRRPKSQRLALLCAARIFLKTGFQCPPLLRGGPGASAPLSVEQGRIELALASLEDSREIEYAHTSGAFGGL